MADASDVERAMVATIAAALFPAGGYQYGAYTASAVTAAPPATAADPTPAAAALTVKLYRGWPEQANLNADLLAGRCHVSVYPEKGMTRNTSRYQLSTEPMGTGAAATITVAVSGATVTLGGTITAGNIVGIQFGPSFAQAAYAYACVAGGTLATTAAALAAKIPGATSSGAVITAPTALGLAASVMAPQPAWTELRRQDAGFRVSAWAPHPEARDALASAVDVAFAGLKNTAGQLTRFMPLDDGTAGFIRYRSSYSDDMPARVRVWRRDLCYSVEYPTTLIEQDPLMLFGTTMLTTADGNVLTGTGAFQPASEVLTDPSGNIWVDAAGSLLGVPPT